jgi:hypothetical protein
LAAASDAECAALHAADAAAAWEVRDWLATDLAGIKIVEKNPLGGGDVSAIELSERCGKKNNTIAISAKFDEGAAAHVKR